MLPLTLHPKIFVLAARHGQVREWLKLIKKSARYQPANHNHLKQVVIDKPFIWNRCFYFAYNGGNGMVFILSRNQIFEECVKLESTVSVHTGSNRPNHGKQERRLQTRNQQQSSKIPEQLQAKLK